MKRGIFLLSLLSAFLAEAPRANALFGAGDVVYDPANVAETINVLHAAQAQFDRLGAMLGVSTQQFDQLVSLAAAVGNAGESSPFLQSLSPRELQGLVQNIPGLEKADLKALFATDGALDAFMGVPLSQWAQAVENPNAFYRSILVDSAIARVGQSAGLSPPAVAYAQWYAARSPQDRYNLASRASSDFANLLADDWLGNAMQRRINLQALSAASQSAQGKASEAKTLADGQHAQAQLSAGTNQILIESAAQAVNAQETAVRAAGAQNQILTEQNEARRNAAEMQLDASL